MTVQEKFKPHILSRNGFMEFDFCSLKIQ